MQRCSDCGHKLYKETKYMSWLKVMNFVDCLETEGIIETSTGDSIRDAMMDFKEYALEETFPEETKA